MTTPVLSIEIKEGVIKVSPIVKPVEPKYSDYVQHTKYYWQVNKFERKKKEYEAALLAYEGSFIKVSNPEVLSDFLVVKRLGEDSMRVDGMYPVPSGLQMEVMEECCAKIFEWDEHPGMVNCYNAEECVNKIKLAIVSFLGPEEAVKEEIKELDLKISPEVKAILEVPEIQSNALGIPKHLIGNNPLMQGGQPSEQTAEDRNKALEIIFLASKDRYFLCPFDEKQIEVIYKAMQKYSALKSQQAREKGRREIMDVIENNCPSVIWNMFSDAIREPLEELEKLKEVDKQ